MIRMTFQYRNGIGINKIDDITQDIAFANSPYFYHLYRLIQQQNITISRLHSFSVYVLATSKEDSIVIKENGIIMNQGDMVQVENSKIILKTFAPTTILVAGVIESYTNDKIIKVVREKNIYKVMKPWGYELWINGEHPKYILKKVMIKASKRTSLQYHRFKRETNVIFQGEANIHYKKTNKMNDNVTMDDIGTVKVVPITSIDVYPDTLHRVEALTDIVLYETSTPHLDDVIRVQDDLARTNGRILSEHGEI